MYSVIEASFRQAAVGYELTIKKAASAERANLPSEAVRQFYEAFKQALILPGDGRLRFCRLNIVRLTPDLRLLNRVEREFLEVTSGALRIVS
jgi:hypothetical protein